MTTSTFTVHTKADKTAEAKTTRITIDWDGITEADLRAIATSAIVIKTQAAMRKNGIPETITVKATDYKPGTRGTKVPPTAEKLLEKLSKEEQAKLLELLMAAE